MLGFSVVGDIMIDPIGVAVAVARLGGLFFILWQPSQRSFLGWLAVFIVVVVIITIRQRKRAGIVGRDEILEQAFPKAAYLHRSSITDAKFFFVDKVFEFMFLGTIVLASPWVADRVAELLRTAVGEQDAAPLSASPPLLIGFALHISSSPHARQSDRDLSISP